MKKSIILLLAISLLLQSCYSYKTINPSCSYLTLDKTYKIKQQNEFEKVKIKSFIDSTITVINGKNEKQISKSGILKMKERKFSTGKTVAFGTRATVVGVIGLFVATYKGPQIGGSMQMPP